ncbi:CC0125/CC1285 family lipoprotein [Phenylobacterium sp.]|uniref:CC0125/CC1285 family lipoprotein n=1 Tax=Phenylobacterium sp. TaxID=1871053 RepID=UPI003927B532
MKRLIVPALAALSLAACATQPTVYQPAAGPSAIGYSEYRIEPGRYRVTFQGGPGASPRYVSDLALLRAADLAVADGYDWFQVTDRFMQGRGDSGARLGLGVGGADFGRHSSVGLGLGTSFNLGGGPSVAATLEVLMGRGPRPPGLDTYDAQALRRNLAPRG